MDKSSFEQLYLQQLPGLYRLAMSILHHRDDAQDAVQQSVLEAWKKVDHIRGGKEKAYLARIVINECHNIQRRGKRMIPAEEITLPQAPPDADRTMHDLILSLPEKYRTPAVLIFMEGMTAAQAAKALGIPQGTVHSRVHRARQILKEKWEEAQEE